MRANDPRASVCGFTRSRGDARKGRDEGGYRGLERETPGELERKEELKDETEKDGV